MGWVDPPSPKAAGGAQWAWLPLTPNWAMFVLQGGLSFSLPRNEVCLAHTEVAASKEVQVPNGAQTSPHLHVPSG